uniref:Uncharacterized protein n=1 Tax=Plectus sambesii TaxID=2011161 RepID=A0A914UL40_9BILA
MLAVRLKSKAAVRNGVGSNQPSYGALLKDGVNDEAMKEMALEGTGETEQMEIGHLPRPPRLHSTGTLQRLVLVAQALEGHRRSSLKNDHASTRVLLGIRSINMVLLAIINALLMTGLGQYKSKDYELTLTLSVDKWQDLGTLPDTFTEMHLNGQYLAIIVAVSLLFATFILQLVQVFKFHPSRLLCMCYSFGAVPFALLVFGLEMHYSSCPWLDDFYRHEIRIHRDFSAVTPFLETACSINGWAIAGILSLFSCGLFISDGLINAFLHADNKNKISAETAV